MGDDVSAGVIRAALFVLHSYVVYGRLIPTIVYYHSQRIICKRLFGTLSDYLVP